MNSQPQCPRCRERHDQFRTLSYDGKGINSCGMYRSRIATFEGAGPAGQYGDLFAAATDMLEALKALARAAANRENTMGDVSRLIECQAELRAATENARAIIARAEGA